MQNHNVKEPEDFRISQIIDANVIELEGLRVLEDWLGLV